MKIVAFRHPQKTASYHDGMEPITAYGAQQIFSAALALPGEIKDKVARIIHSGVPRAWQSAEIIKAALLINVPIELNTALDVRRMFVRFNPREALAQMHAARSESDTALHVVNKTEYAKVARQEVTTILLQVADQMRNLGEEAVILVSHSPFIEMAVDGTGADQVPSAIYEADAIIYTVQDGKIVSSVYYPAPVKGERI